MIHNGVRIELRQGTVGPGHDPYGYTSVNLSTNDGRSAELYTDGLGTWRYRARPFGSDGPQVEERFHDGDPRERQLKLKFQLRAKRLFRLTFEEAEQAFREWDYACEADPMGPASRYI